MTDQARSRLRRSLEHHEDKRTRVYDDATGKPLKAGMTLIGHPTIGVGRNLSGRGLREDEIAFLLENDIDECVLDLVTHFPWFEGLDEVRQRVLAELRFALGPGKFRGFKKMLAACKRGDWGTAGLELMRSKWSKQVGARSVRLALMLRLGVDQP